MICPNCSYHACNQSFTRFSIVNDSDVAGEMILLTIFRKLNKTYHNATCSPNLYLMLAEVFPMVQTLFYRYTIYVTEHPSELNQVL